MSDGQKRYNMGVKSLLRAMVTSLRGCFHNSCFAIALHRAEFLGLNFFGERLIEALERANKEKMVDAP